jgi:hypothetical protein
MIEETLLIFKRKRIVSVGLEVAPCAFRLTAYIISHTVVFTAARACEVILILRSAVVDNFLSLLLDMPY